MALQICDLTALPFLQFRLPSLSAPSTAQTCRYQATPQSDFQTSAWGWRNARSVRFTIRFADAVDQNTEVLCAKCCAKCSFGLRGTSSTTKSSVMFTTNWQNSCWRAQRRNGGQRIRRPSLSADPPRSQARKHNRRATDCGKQSMNNDQLPRTSEQRAFMNISPKRLA